jgi:hypothetical protein
MPTAFRGYPCRMKQAVKATVLILFVSLLSGCSSSPELADKPQAKTDCEIATEKSTEMLEKIQIDSDTKGKEYVKLSLLTWAFYVMEKSECFSSETVATARATVALVQK